MQTLCLVPPPDSLPESPGTGSAPVHSAPPVPPALAGVLDQLDLGELQEARRCLAALPPDLDPACRRWIPSLEACLEFEALAHRGRRVELAGLLPRCLGPALDPPRELELFWLVWILARDATPGQARSMDRALRGRTGTGTRPVTELSRALCLLAAGGKTEVRELVESHLGAPDGEIPRRLVRELVLALGRAGQQFLARRVATAFQGRLLDPWGGLVRSRLARYEGRLGLPLSDTCHTPVTAWISAWISPSGPGAGEAETLALPWEGEDTGRWLLDALRRLDIDCPPRYLRETPEGRDAISAPEYHLGNRAVPDRNVLVLDLRRSVARLGAGLTLDLSARPLLIRILAEIVRSGEAGVTAPELFTRCWKQAFDPEIHDRNVYSALSRLRVLGREAWSGREVIRNDRSGRYQPVPGLRHVLLDALPWKDRYRLEEDAGEILELLRTGPRPVKEIAFRLQRSPETVRRNLRVLFRRHLVARIGRGSALTFRLSRLLLNEMAA